MRRKRRPRRRTRTTTRARRTRRTARRKRRARRSRRPDPVTIELLQRRTPSWAAILDAIATGVSSDLARIFEPFYRATDARRASPKGVGLGLAVARRIAQSLGGQLEAESQPGVGSRFRLALLSFEPKGKRPDASS